MTISPARALLLAALTLAAAALPAAAQVVMPGDVTAPQKISGDSGGFLVDLDALDALGSGVASLGDLDGDGRNEIVVGAPGDDDGGGSRGAIWILHPKANGTLETWSKITSLDPVFGGDLTNHDDFGFDVDVIGDLDDDGHQDLIVGAPGDDDACCQDGAAWILFLDGDGEPRSAAKLSARTAPLDAIIGPRDRFGDSVAGIGDFDGDGVEDVAVGAPFHDGAFTWDIQFPAGAVFVLTLHPDGTVKTVITLSEDTLVPPFPPMVSAFGASVASPGDLDGNGVPEIAFGSTSGEGRLYIAFMEADGSVTALTEIGEGLGGFSGTLDSNDQWATSIAPIGDLDGNGVPDLAVGAPFDDDGGGNTGAIWLLFLEADGTVRSDRKISETAGTGFPGTLLPGDAFGQDVAVLGDLTLDGTLELVIGVPGEDDDAGGAGGVWVASFADGPWFDVGFGLTGTNNKPRLKGEGVLVDNALIELQLTRAKANAPATLVVGFAPLFAPLKGGTLVPAAHLLIGATTDGLGKIDLPAIWPPAVPPGVPVWFQWWIVDEVGVQGFAASNGLQAYTP